MIIIILPPSCPCFHLELGRPEFRLGVPDGGELVTMNQNAYPRFPVKKCRVNSMGCWLTGKLSRSRDELRWNNFGPLREKRQRDRFRYRLVSFSTLLRRGKRTRLLLLETVNCKLRRTPTQFPPTLLFCHNSSSRESTHFAFSLYHSPSLDLWPHHHRLSSIPINSTTMSTSARRRLMRDFKVCPATLPPPGSEM